MRIIIHDADTCIHKVKSVPFEVELNNTIHTGTVQITNIQKADMEDFRAEVLWDGKPPEGVDEDSIIDAVLSRIP